MRTVLCKASLVILAAVWGLLFPSMLTFGAALPPSSIPVRDFIATGDTLNVIEELASKCQVVIGVYGVFDDRKPKTITIQTVNGTLADALNAITKADPRWEWHQSNNGAIHFVSRGAPASPLELKVNSFDFYSFHHFQLEAIPVVHRWFRKHNCSTDWSEMHTGGESPPWPTFSVHAKDVPVYAIFDEIAAKSGSNYWSLTWYRDRPCFLTEKWGDTRHK